MKIPKEHIVAAEIVSSDVYDKKITVENGALLLFQQHGINVNSAKDFIFDYRHLIAGEVFKRSMSSLAIDYFLAKIREKRGEEAYQNSVVAFEKHIQYLEKGRTKNRKIFRKVLERHKGNIGLSILDNYDETFEEDVQNALNLTAEERNILLTTAPKKPRLIEVKAQRFVRSPYIVAAVLIRAEGKCERCGSSAPFIKKKNNQPYLEVHHKVRLADGGDDTVENAIAICPNCHRYLHFGS